MKWMLKFYNLKIFLTKIVLKIANVLRLILMHKVFKQQIM